MGDTVNTVDILPEGKLKLLTKLVSLHLFWARPVL